jgi:hypothetical protein
VRSTSRGSLETPKTLRLGLRPQPRYFGCGFAALRICVEILLNAHGASALFSGRANHTAISPRA